MRVVTILVLIVAALMVLPSRSDYYNGYYEVDSDSSGDVKEHTKTKDIVLGKVQMRENNDVESDEALEEFSLAAGSHINLRLWQVGGK